MAVKDKKLEKLIKRSELLDKRIKDDTAERKRIQDEIDLLSYANLKEELAKNNMSADIFAQFISMNKKMADKNLSVEDVEKILDSISKNTEEIDDEKKIF